MINNLKLVSPLRNNIFKLDAGQAAIFDITGSALVPDKARGSAMVTCGRINLFTFLVAKCYTFDTDQPVDFEMIGQDFAKHEEYEVITRLYNVEDIVYADKSKVVELQKFFSDLGRKILVLPAGKRIDIGKEFTLVEGKAPAMEMVSLPQRQMRCTVWEEIGFILHGPLPS